ncbi:MAG: hypothetical protein QOE92_2111 [Chloroflexota bacterium]|jgi:alkanesulfonate monooxygenase SsuD/methylene tetrahydromethanopterin reductase-like flavin-dependent oxidoreductase (luciferase family)|nr:hypothetical protein [Chloroflexota bacterium]
MQLGLGIAAGPDPDRFATLAAEAETLGYTSIWSNDSPAGEGLAMLAAWAGSSTVVDLGVGVMALDRHTPEAIAGRVTELGLAADRLLLGLGAGFNAGPLGAVREGVAALRERLPGVRLVVAAMGPKMCALAGEVADAALLNWMTPDRARLARGLVKGGAEESGRDPGEVTVHGYVRVAMGTDAADRLANEAGFYTQMPHYARHFEASGVEPRTIGVAAADETALRQALAEYDALDTLVVRVLSEREPAAILAVAAAASGGQPAGV